MKNEGNNRNFDKKKILFKLKQIAQSMAKDAKDAFDWCFPPEVMHIPQYDGDFIEDQPGWLEGMDEEFYDFVDDDEIEEEPTQLEEPVINQEIYDLLGDFYDDCDYDEGVFDQLEEPQILRLPERPTHTTPSNQPVLRQKVYTLGKNSKNK